MVLSHIKLYYRNGFSFFPLFPSTKTPVVRHAPYYERQPTREELRAWLDTYFNPRYWREVWEGKRDPHVRERWIKALENEFRKVGRKVEDYTYEGEINIAIAGGFCAKSDKKLILIDIEDVSKFCDGDPVEFFSQYGNFIIVKTGKPNGYHLYALGDWDKNVKGDNGEIRVNNQYVVAPPSRHPNGRYYALHKMFDISRLSVLSKEFIEKTVLKWIGADESGKERKGRGYSIIWESIKDAAKKLPVEHGKRSDWTFALTSCAKALIGDERKAFEELLEIPIVYSKVTRDGKWDYEKAYEWWKKYEWDDVEKTGILSTLYVLRWAEKETGMKLDVDLNKIYREFFETTREKGYGHLLSEEDIILEIVNILDSCIEVIEKGDKVIEDVRSDYIHVIAEGLNHMFYFACPYEFDELYMYENGVYKPCEWKIKKWLQVAWGRSRIREKKSLTIQIVNEIISALRRFNYRPLRTFYAYSNRYINVKNGLIDIEKWEFKPHRPEMLFLTQVNAKWDPDAKSELWDKFIEKVVPKEYRDVLQEFAGYCLLPDCRFEKALAIVGPGGSGKSTFLEAIRSVLGFDNVTSFSIQQLENERFTKAELVGKFANIYNDLPYDALEKSDVFKQIVSGDPIQVERKFKKPFVARITAKLIFSANQLPPTRDVSTAFFRRWIIVLFPNVVENPDPTLKFKLTRDENVKSYILKWMVEGLKRLLRNGKFSYDLSTEEIEEFYSQASDSVKTFIDEHIVKDPNASISRTELYEKYVAFCKRKGYPVLSRTAFVRRINGYTGAGTKTVRGVRYFTGIRYVENKETNEEEPQTPEEAIIRIIKRLDNGNGADIVDVYRKFKVWAEEHGIPDDVFDKVKNRLEDRGEIVCIDGKSKYKVVV